MACCTDRKCLPEYHPINSLTTPTHSDYEVYSFDICTTVK